MGRCSLDSSSVISPCYEVLISDLTAGVDVHELLCIIIQVVSAECARIPLASLLLLGALHGRI